MLHMRRKVQRLERNEDLQRAIDMDHESGDIAMHQVKVTNLKERLIGGSPVPWFCGRLPHFLLCAQAVLIEHLQSERLCSTANFGTNEPVKTDTVFNLINCMQLNTVHRQLAEYMS
jgi:hypothetical protein